MPVPVARFVTQKPVLLYNTPLIFCIHNPKNVRIIKIYIIKKII